MATMLMRRDIKFEEDMLYKCMENGLANGRMFMKKIDLRFYEPDKFEFEM